MAFPFRTHCSELNDHELIILDVLLLGGCRLKLLQNDIFAEAFNLPYAHGLNDLELMSVLDHLCQNKWLRLDEDDSYYYMTSSGEAIWESERQPQWQYFVFDSFDPLDDENARFSILSPDLQTAENYLFHLQKEGQATQINHQTSSNYSLFDWLKFSTIYEITGLIKGYISIKPPNEPEHKWWRDVTDLQLFVESHT
ncbi:MAG: hypothetical protein JST84_26005 [Acidobacteria bacterium]|nr:hypothetical protein [Acidobacteriota bacterium]